MPPRQGDIFDAKVPGDHSVGHEQAGFRPWLVVSANHLNSTHPEMVLAAPLTTKLKKRKGHPHRILIDRKADIAHGGGGPGLAHDSLVLTDQVRALSTKRIVGGLRAKLTDRALYQVHAGLSHVFGL